MLCADRIRQLRDKKQMLQRQFAAAMDIDRPLFSKIERGEQEQIIALPFYHLCSEPFWKLIANAGCEKWIESKSSMRSFGNLTTAVKYALIDKELSDLLLIPENRDILKRLIV
jgi:putative restriction endonuclease